MDAESKQRAIGAIVGCIVSDAAAQPIHWMYDMERLKTILAHYDQPEFIAESYNPFYKIPTGSNSCYGDQAYVLLKCLATNKGFNKSAYIEEMFNHFGPKSPYEVNLGHPITQADWPIPGPWRNNSVKVFINNVEKNNPKTGAVPDAQSDCFAKIVPLVALYAGNPELASLVEEVIRITQEDDLAVQIGLSAAELLEHYILHGKDPEAIIHLQNRSDENLRKLIGVPISMKDKFHDDVVTELQSNCGLPQNFQNSLHCLLNADGNFTNSVRLTLTAGGCNCSRCCFVGACLGAQYGLSAICDQWISKTFKGKEVSELAHILFET